jgi:hypothetical protein
MQQKEWLEGNVQLQMCVLEKNENLKWITFHLRKREEEIKH